MDRAGHIEVHEAYEFVIACLGELYRVAQRADDVVEGPQHTGIHASGPVEAGALGRSPGAADRNSKLAKERLAEPGRASET